MARARILVVEDNEDLAFGLRTVLEFEGYEVEVASNGEEALDAVKAGSLALVLLVLLFANPFTDRVRSDNPERTDLFTGVTNGIDRITVADGGAAPVTLERAAKGMSGFFGSLLIGPAAAGL